MKVFIEGDELVIRLKINDPPVPSKTAKSLIVATSHGPVTTGIEHSSGERLIVVANAYVGWQGKPMKGHKIGADPFSGTDDARYTLSNKE